MCWNGRPDQCPKDDSCYEYYESNCKGTENIGRVCKRKRKLMKWYTMEYIQDKVPYLEIGWSGYVPMIIYRNRA